MNTFALGMLAGGLLTLVVLAAVLRIMGQRQPAIPSVQTGVPELTLSLKHDLIQRLVADGLRDLSLPLISLRDPYVQLESGGRLTLRLRGDTVLLGGQVIVLRMRLMPAPNGVRVVTESADVSGLGNVVGALTERLDEQINAELAQRLAFANQFEVLSVDTSDDEVLIQARLRDS